MTESSVVRADALFEAVLGLVLLAGAATRALDASDFPSPVGVAVIAAVGVLLLVVAYVILSKRVGVAALAAGNMVTAIAALLWLVLASGFSATGAAIVAITAAALSVLAAAQAVTLRRSPAAGDARGGS
jgi:hypothetical protein